MDTESYPIDTSKYSRGDRIPREELMRLVGMRDIGPADEYSEYRRRVLRIRTHLMDKIGAPVEFVGDELYILNDGHEQDLWCQRKALQAKRSLRAAFDFDISTNPALLSDSDQKARADRILRNGQLIQMMRGRKALPELRPTPKRLT